MTMAADSYTAEVLGKCPKCGEKTLRSVDGRGEDDHGQLEGERDICENKECDYDSGWSIGRC